MQTGGNGHTSEYKYEADSALDELNHWTGVPVTSTQTVGYSFDYNLANQVTSRVVSDNTFIYAHASDKNDGYTANGLNQYSQITQSGVNFTLTYDGNGSLTSDGAWSYVYDVENRLTRATGPGGAVDATYDYDPLGRRAQKSGSGVVTEVYLNDGVEEIADGDGSGNILRRYVHGPGVDEYLAMYSYDAATGTETGRQYYHADHLGSIIAMTDAGTGNVDDVYTYGAYGETSDPTGNPFRYTGRRIDAETGLYYYRARYYAPTLGRFLQTDPIGYGDNMNMYAYVGNDPINATDPSGNQEVGGQLAVRLQLNSVVPPAQPLALPSKLGFIHLFVTFFVMKLLIQVALMMTNPIIQQAPTQLPPAMWTKL